MGSLAESSSLQTLKMMKSIAVVALCMFAAAAGEADASADAGLLYGHYGYGHHLGYAHHGYYGYPYAHHYGHYYGKRSADAEPTAAAEPKADAFYGYGYGLAHHGYGYAHHGYYGYPYAHHGYYYGKRSADAEPTADAAYAHYGYGHGYYGHGYAHHGYYGYPYAHRGYFYG